MLLACGACKGARSVSDLSATEIAAFVEVAAVAYQESDTDPKDGKVADAELEVFVRKLIAALIAKLGAQ